MKKHIGKIVGSVGILLVVVAVPIGQQLTPFFKGKPEGPMLSITGGFDHSRDWILAIAVIGGVLTLAGIVTEVISGIAENRKARQNKTLEHISDSANAV